MDRRRLPLIFLVLSFAVVSCNAPVDAELQLRSIVVKLNKGKVRKRGAAAVAAPQKTPRVKRYTSAEIKRLLVPDLKTSPAPASSVTAKVTPRSIPVVFHTAKGKIGCQLFPDEAPQAVANFLALASGKAPWTVGKQKMTGRFYDGLDFHRAITGFIIQTGNPGSKPTDGPGWNIEREKGAEARWSKSGVMGVVESGGDNHGSQFFITMKPARHLAGKYTPFGRCTNLAVVRVIGNAPKLPGVGGDKPKIPRDPVQLKKVTIGVDKG